MAAKIFEAVLDHGPRDRAQALVLLALAENANNEGGAYPGLPKITHRARVTERQTNRILHQLKDDGWVTVKRNAAGETGKCTLYQLNLVKLGLSLDIQPSSENSSSLDIEGEGHSTFCPVSLDISTIPILRNLRTKEPKTASAKKPVLRKVYLPEDARPLWTIWRSSPDFNKNDHVTPGLAQMARALNEYADAGDGNPLAILTARTSAHIEWRRQELAKKESDPRKFVSAMPHAATAFGKTMRAYLNASWDPVPEPMAILPDGSTVPLSTTEKEGWVTVGGVSA